MVRLPSGCVYIGCAGVTLDPVVVSCVRKEVCHFSSRCSVFCVQSLSALCETHVLSVQV